MLGVNYCRENEAKVGVSIFVKNDQFNEQDIDCNLNYPTKLLNIQHNP
jgi:hypothetical protein